MNPSANEPPSIRALIERFDMHYLEGESGYYGLRENSAFEGAFDGTILPAQSSIYYLLTAQLPTNFLHWLASEDTHILVSGGPADYYIFLETGEVQKVTLGTDYNAGQLPAVTVPARSYKAIQLQPGAEHAFFVNTLTPAWTPDRVKIGPNVNFLETYSEKSSWATEGFLQSLFPKNSN